MVETLVERINFILSLQDDWDGEGSPGYKKETIDKALKAMEKMKPILEEKFLEIPEPEFNQGPNSGIDVEWEGRNYSILLYVPPGNPAPDFFWRNLL